ncbi:prepilin-type N-terminal cleavage/methylation domain-containing protein [Deinococcus sp. Arct2-2]|uniref:PulJ/GspJ family protein n=1 Tax=Deinococcus sp. Arct2-2 TaxID=2568653 RepID=UPI0010A4A0D8|nr:prepilin-type N-terminal cleavage/methylation domain-containing protein [Deinococcus sp. Arct2-2]THF71653.1 prepilin-type N-terminal cleavage/methylation domain-containing protein [Deinococcus sp. Arct2-2]
MNGKAGFTLVELLIAMALSLVVFGIASQLMQSSSQFSQLSIANSSGIRDAQMAANVIADDVRRAVSIGNPGTLIDLGSAATGAPGAIGNNLLVLTSSAVVGGRCTTPFEFTAYYFVLRSALASADEWTRPVSDANNGSQRVLVQYSACADKTDTTATLTNGQVRLTTDFLGQGSFTYAGLNSRRVTLNLQAAKSIRGRTVSGAPIALTVFARNIN